MRNRATASRAMGPGRLCLLLALLRWSIVEAVVEWTAWHDENELGRPSEANGWKPLPGSNLYTEIDWEVANRPNAYRMHHPNATHYTLGEGKQIIEATCKWQHARSRAHTHMYTLFRGCLGSSDFGSSQFGSKLRPLSSRTPSPVVVCPSTCEMGRYTAQAESSPSCSRTHSFSATVGSQERRGTGGAQSEHSAMTGARPTASAADACTGGAMHSPKQQWRQA